MTHQHMDIWQNILKLIFTSLKLILSWMTAFEYAKSIGAKRADYLFIHALASLTEISRLKLELSQVFECCWILRSITALLLFRANIIDAVIIKAASMLDVVLLA